MTQKDSVGSSIVAGRGEWSFASSVPETFVDHIRQSVPGYDEGHDLICEVSDFFLRNDGVIYEIGCSTGQLIRKLASRNPGRADLSWVGLDNVPEMIAKCEAECRGMPNISFLLEDVRNFRFENTDLILSYYAVQFIPPRDRQDLIDKIYAALNWGGALIIFEKVRGPDARFQDMLSNLYTNFKLRNGFSAEEILAKTESLKGVLEPFSSRANVEMLERAGFKDIMPIYRNICFEGLVCIK